jgi:hypothetical protein
MTWKDKLEIGLKDDAPFRQDNLPSIQRRTRRGRKKPGDPTRSAEEPGARAAAEHGANPLAGRRRRRRSPK